MKKEVKYKEIGLPLRAIRERLKLTLDSLRKEVGISAGYISDFERGIKLPTPKYLRHLHDKYKVSLDYVFGSSSRMFQPGQEERERLEFGKYQEEVDDMLEHMSKIPHALFSMLVHFSHYKVENEEFIDKCLSRKETDKEKEKESEKM
jgi:transcriptional regulator with XRE-family HTH domain